MTSVRAINTCRDQGEEITIRRHATLPNHPKGTHTTDLVQRPQLVRSVSGLYRNDSTEDLLFKIDSTWREDKLFTRSSDPEDNFYYEYLSDLQLIADENEDFWSRTLNPGNKKTNLFKEFTALCNNTDLTAFQRALCATQALELTLLGANPTGVLKNLNSMGTGSKGFRNELLAGWFLAKFVYQLSTDKQFKFVHSEMLPTTHICKKFKPKTEDGTTTHRETKVTRLDYSFLREVDISTENALASVKCSGNHFAELICDLFFVVVDNQAPNGTNLKTKIKKLILIKTAEKPEQLLPNYKHSVEYWELKDKIIADVKRKIEELYPLESQGISFRDCYDKLISKHGIDLYYLPPVESTVREKDCIKELQDWISENYRALDRSNLPRTA